MTVIDHPERVKACQRGELAERMVATACQLACLVRDSGRDEIGKFLATLGAGERDALLVVLAAMVPDDTAPGDLLSWITWDEYGRPLPSPSHAKGGGVALPPRRRPGRAAVQPCGTYAAYSRHKDRGELIDGECTEAARAYWRDRERTKRAKAGEREAADAAA